MALARLSVERLADWCVIDLFEDGRLRGEPLGLAHVDASLEGQLRRGWQRLAHSSDSHAWMETELRGPSARLVQRATLSWPRELATPCMMVPLTARSRVMGVLALGKTQEDAEWNMADHATAEDLARRCALAFDAAQLYRETQAAVEARDEFLSAASHELRTPLTSLNLQLQNVLRKLGLQDTSVAVLRPKIEAAERQARRLARLIDNLLDVSRISSNRLDLQLEPLDLSVLVQEVVTREKEDLAKAGCALELQTNGPRVGEWDRLRLDQVLTNLLSNAAKYGGGHPVEVAVGGDETIARLTVRDHGIGIAPADQARIFDRFERSVAQREYGGFGLGLWIVRQIVQALGGSIRVEGEPGSGAVFIVELPLSAKVVLSRQLEVAGSS